VIRVLICDDQWIVCEGLEAILNADPEIEVVGIAHDGMEAVDLVAQTRPEIVLMDLRMPVLNGIQATQRIREAHPEVKVLVLTTYGADEWVFDAIRSGASGYLLKGTSRTELIAAIKGTAAGQTFVDPDVAGRLFEQIAQHKSLPPNAEIVKSLSDRELDVLRLLARGFSNAGIAEKLYLSEGTVRNYVSAILTKLEVSDRTQAALLAIRYGLVDLSEI